MVSHLVVLVAVLLLTMDHEDFLGLQVLLHRDREPRMDRLRADPTQSMSDPEFYRHYRFRYKFCSLVVGLLYVLLSKESTMKIARMLEPDLIYKNNRGQPLSPHQKVCLALHHYAGNQFQRVSGVCGGVSQEAARQAVVRVTDALVKRKQDFIFMPTVQEMEDTSSEMLERFHLPRFSMAVDGMMVRFVEAPRRLPPGKHKQQFWCR